MPYSDRLIEGLWFAIGLIAIIVLALGIAIGYGLGSLQVPPAAPAVVQGKLLSHAQ